MLEQPHRLLLDELCDHVAQDGADRVESLVGGADICQADIIQQDLLDDKDGHRLAQLRARLHDTQAEGDDLGGEQEVDDVRRVVLD